MKRFGLLIVLCFAIMASIPAVTLGGKVVGTSSPCAAVFGTENASACGQDINYHAYPYEQCYPHPFKAWYTYCWNDRDGWHEHYPMY